MFKQFKLIDKTSSYKSGSSIAGVGVNSKNLSPEEYKSLIFNSGSSQYLNRTPASAGNRKTWTWSGWVKRSKLGTETAMFDAGNNDQIRFISANPDRIRFNFQNATVRETNAVYRDTSSWYHIVLAVDTTSATANDRIRLYVNGSEVTSFDTLSNPAQNADGEINSTSAHSVGRLSGGSGYFDGYLTEINFIDGQALSSENFGYFDTIGIWQPRKYSGSYGINGFYLPLNNPNFFELAKDKSGNSNHWTLNGYSSSLASNVVVSDSPINNYATWNPLATSEAAPVIFSNGNLDVSFGSSLIGRAQSTIGVSSGKWYAEVTVTAASGTDRIIGIVTLTTNNQPGYTADSYGYYGNGQKINNNALTNYGASYTTNDIIGIALDLDAGTITFYKNNTSQGQAFSGLSGTYLISVSDSSNVGTCSYTANFGQRPFAYAVPSGFKTLCTQNLPTPTIKKPSSYMDVITFTATGANQSITGLNFSPDLVWIKNRATWAGNRHTLYDTTRTSGYRLDSSTTEAEEADNDLYAFNSDGFSGNYSGTTYVAWNWKESPIAGMDIVSFASPSGTAQSTVAHNLGVAPKMIISKNRDTSANNWAVFHSSVCDTTSKFLQLNTTAGITTFSTVWGASLPTSSVFGITGGGVAASGVNCIAYLFAEIEGFSKFGSYTGNGSADGPFVYCGFRPRWVMIKRTDTSIEHWQIQDSVRSVLNPVQNNLFPNISQAEQIGGADRNYDFVSNGFKLRGDNTGTNGSGGTYIFAAFAESPFKYSRAR